MGARIMRVYEHDEIVNEVYNVIIDLTREVIQYALEEKKLLRSDLDKVRLKQILNFITQNQKIMIARINKRASPQTLERPDIEVFAGLIVVEVESSEDQLSEGEKQLKNYIYKYYDIANYGILTTGLTWRFFKREENQLKLVYEGKASEKLYREGFLGNAIRESNVYDFLKKVILESIIQSQVYRYKPTPHNIYMVFHPVLTYVDIIKDFVTRFEINQKAVYKSYEDVLRRIYPKLTDEDLLKLFATHTLLQMIVNTILSASFGATKQGVLEICSGETLPYDISVPHLLWYKEVIREYPQKEEFFKQVCEDIYSRALLFDWNMEVMEDVFSHLYEDFIERSLRYSIGEYYTPWWLIQLMIKLMKQKFSIIFNSKTIFDPACGSGRFLVMSFYEKTKEEGEDPDKAYYEILGLDINPLAVSIARAELMIAYRRVTRGNPPGTPLIFWGDFLANEIGHEVEIVDELRDILNHVTLRTWEMMNKISKLHSNHILIFLARLEYNLSQILKLMSKSTTSVGFNMIEKILFSNHGDEINELVSELLLKVFSENNIVKKLQDLVSKYGNEIWSIPITSHLFVILLGKIAPQIVLTNPPWLKLSEVEKNESKWGKAVRESVDKIIKNKENLLPGIAKAGMAGDISTLFLNVILKLVTAKRSLETQEREGFVGIVLPAEQSYSTSPHGVGKIFTYAILSDYDVEGMAIYVGDAFRHGREASVFILKVSRR